MAFAADVNVPFFCRHRTRKQSRPSCDGETIAASVRSTVRCPRHDASPKLSPSVSQTLLSPTNSTALLVSSLCTVSSRMALCGTGSSLGLGVGSRFWPWSFYTLRLCLDTENRQVMKKKREQSLLTLFMLLIFCSRRSYFLHSLPSFIVSA